MFHRVREAMRVLHMEPIGGEGIIVEADETFIGNKGKHRTRGWSHKEKVMSLVERGGKARSFHVPNIKKKTLEPIIMANLKKDTPLMTDDAAHYLAIGEALSSHQSVSHSLGEYVRGNAHTNTIEGYFSIFKRGMTGVYQHCGSQHLQRYLNEFDFRYSERQLTDIERANVALAGIVGKRLTYRWPN